MEIKKQEIGHYTTLFTLEGEKNNYQRMVAYNNILFENLYLLAHKKKQIIVINEMKTGGVIYGSSNYAYVALEKLKKFNQDLVFEVIGETKSNEGELLKIGLSIKPKNTNWEI